MNIMLGNLTVEEIERRAGFKFKDELKVLLNETHQSEANNVLKGKWHCFDLPFTMVVGGMPLAEKIYNLLKDYPDSFKNPMQIALSPESKS